MDLSRPAVSRRPVARGRSWLTGHSPGAVVVRAVEDVSRLAVHALVQPQGRLAQKLLVALRAGVLCRKTEPMPAEEGVGYIANRQTITLYARQTTVLSALVLTAMTLQNVCETVQCELYY